ncbi:O-methyltransferase [Croceitalea rosinachiae]|uniref:Class I SAM-dependent methyltransferase n=1 Tax=Croceitalea rosinachiae TaxID=3075596 RepID=A0ABU3AD53_9FLAO|nr:class I SAM-dependent methyltransferase [Croceitalea sp. F388]MDT0607730.1 class I SAM-dependent methyltransferase [Croceitalea sp. F388]
MNDSNIKDIPIIHHQITQKSKEIGFTMPSDLFIGTLLKTLIASKPRGLFLELGTGIGLSLSWMIDGMDINSKLITVDNDPELIAIANQYFGANERVKIVCEDGTKWINNYKGNQFDLIFADAWPGKYSELDEILNLIQIGGFYVIDDMSTQPNWPEGHQDNVDGLITYLEKREDFNLTKMNWSTGVIIAVRTK